MKKLGLQPLVGANARILILGSLPGDESLRKQEYYGNPRNMFWDVMGAVLGEPAPSQYAEKTEYLKRHGIALWDVFPAKRLFSVQVQVRCASAPVGIWKNLSINGVKSCNNEKAGQE